MEERYELLKKMGNLQQAAAVRKIEFQEGRARGMQGYDIKNGALRFQVMGDKCLDISELSYKGINFSFLAKPGLIGRMDFDTCGEEGTANLMGGLLFTCGLENTCLPCREGDASYPMHGRIRFAPAEFVSAGARWEGNRYRMAVSGQMREAKIFGNHMALRREIETIYGERKIVLTDEIENLAYREEPMMILYHFNMGYPFLDENAKVILPTKKVTPRDEAACRNQELWYQMEAPADNEPERVYLHELADDQEGNTFACCINEERKLGLRIRFSKQYLPYFVQWKSLASGDYVMGLEPTNSGVYGRSREGDGLHKIKPFETEKIRISIEILDGEEEIRQAEEEAASLCHKTMV